MLGTYAPQGTQHHRLANLTDEEAARLEGKARDFYRRALELVNTTGCSLQMAILALQDAEAKR